MKVTPLDPAKKYTVLFCGNSFTYFYDLPHIFMNYAAAIGYDFEAVSHTRGGAELTELADADAETGRDIDATLKSRPFDYVVMQEMSTKPAESPEGFFDGVTGLYEKIKKNGASPVMYATWGREDGHETLAGYGWTHESMMWKLAASYHAAADAIGASVADVGIAFNYVYRNHPDLLPFIHDGSSHPSEAGSCLAAMTILARITGRDPRDIPDDYAARGADSAHVGFAFEGFAKEEFAILREAAYYAVFAEHTIPDEYRITFSA